MRSYGFYVVDVTINGKKYEATTTLNVLDNLCSDIILGLDFQSHHHKLVFEFNGDSPNLIVSNDSKCALAVAGTKEATLFSNLTHEVKPIATKSRRFNEADQVFIHKTVEEWLEEGIIQSSSTPWRAQVVVVKNELHCHKKRLCVDYSLTINICTELIAYRNCNCIFFTMLPWPGDSKWTFRSSTQAVTCPPGCHTRRRLHSVSLIAERQAGKL